MSEKSDKAFRTISEVAIELDLPQHVLRFWETKFRQITPIKRGGGRRYYRPEDVELLRRIKQLLHLEGYTIKGVQRLLSQGGVKNLPDLPTPATPASPAQSKADELGGEPRIALNLAAIVADLEAVRDLLKKSVS